MIKASGSGIKIRTDVNVYGHRLWLWIKLWINIKFHGRVLILRYDVSVNR
jgi:hypothetical protein